MSLIKRVTGPGVTEAVNMVSADLGIVCWDPRRKCNVVVFGDNFAERYMRGEWQSPSIICYDKDFNLLGIPVGTNQIVSSGNRRQALDYTHNAGGISTILPCDLIQLRDKWIMAVMIVGMGGLGDEKATQFFESQDLVQWTKTGPSLEHPGHPGNVMLTFDRIGEYVYIFGTGGLARNRPIYMWRNKADEFPHGHWEPWGMDNVSWAWGNANEHTPILPGRYGELCFRHIQGHCVLSFFDVDRYCCSAITVPRPEDNWTTGNRVDYAWGNQTPQLYGGYIAPDSKLNESGGMKFLVSQWNTSSNDPYHVIQFADTLRAMGPLVVELPEPPEPEPEPPEPEPEPPPKEEAPVTPQETYELLLRELAASGSTEILTATGEKLTLREAVGEIYAQECSLQSLKGHPLHPRESAPQLDHILSGRAEELFTQAVVVAIADHLGLDVGAIYASVRRSIG
jgi:Domain of unknown function (DUF4185)